MNRNDYFSIIKLPNGVYFLWDFREGINSDSLLFALKGVKSKGTTLVLSYDSLNDMTRTIPSMVKFLQSRNINTLDRIFICFNNTMSNQCITNENKLLSYKKFSGFSFRSITKKVLFFDIYQWAKENSIEIFKI